MKYIILLSLIAVASASKAFTGPTHVEGFPIYLRSCEERSARIRPTVRQDFNVAAYSGLWFEIGRYQQQDEPLSDCMTSQYSWGFISRTFSISRIGTDLETGEIFTRSAVAPLAFPDEESRRGLLNVTYYADREADYTNYYVLGTDYFQYAIGWGCEDIEIDGEPGSVEFAWLLSRTPDMPPTYRARVDAYIEEFFDEDLIRETEQDLDLCMGAKHSELRQQYAKMKKA